MSTSEPDLAREIEAGFRAAGRMIDRLTERIEYLDRRIEDLEDRLSGDHR
jgi:hypothetical protein